MALLGLFLGILFANSWIIDHLITIVQQTVMKGKERKRKELEWSEGIHFSPIPWLKDNTTFNTNTTINNNMIASLYNIHLCTFFTSFFYYSKKTIILIKQYKLKINQDNQNKTKINIHTIYKLTSHLILALPQQIQPFLKFSIGGLAQISRVGIFVGI